MGGHDMTRVAGIGCRAGTTRDALAAALAAAGGADALATIAQRADQLHPLAVLLDLPLHIVDVTGIATPTRSTRIEALYGTGSVAEAAALAAAGPGARLSAPRRVSACGLVTIAIAEVP